MWIEPEDIGGAIVRRMFKYGDRQLLRGATLTGDQVRGIRPANLRSMVDKGYLQLWPKREEIGHELFMVHQGKGSWMVIQGRRLHQGFLNKEQAEALCASAVVGDASKH